MDGESCWFVSSERMQEGIAANEFLEVGEHDNYLFGTTFQSVRDVICKENKLCILDCRPEVCLQKNDSFKIEGQKLFHFQYMKGFETASQFL